MAYKKRHPARIIIAIICLIIAAAAATVPASYLYSHWNDDRNYSELADSVLVKDPDAPNDPSKMQVKWEELKKINPEVVAWVYVPNTPINYPVCYSGDNDKYLHTAFDGSTGWWTASGTIFLEGQAKPEITDNVDFLYGHHMDSGSMFACISEFISQDRFDGARDVYLFTPEGNRLYKSFATVLSTGSENIVATNFPADKNRIEYLEDIQRRSTTTPKEGFPKPENLRHVLALTTCDYNEYNGRAILYCQPVSGNVSDDMADEIVNPDEAVHY